MRSNHLHQIILRYYPDAFDHGLNKETIADMFMCRTNPIDYASIPLQELIDKIGGKSVIENICRVADENNISAADFLSFSIAEGEAKIAQEY